MCQYELLADFQEVYGLNLWDYDLDELDEHDARELERIAALAYQLPATSRTRRKASPASHPLEIQLLRRIEHNQRKWAWAHTKDAQQPGAQEPKEIALPGEDEEREAEAKRLEREARETAIRLGIEI